MREEGADRGGLLQDTPRGEAGDPRGRPAGAGGSAGVQKVGLGAGLVDNKICALDDTWSALRFVIRVADRKRC